MSAASIDPHDPSCCSGPCSYCDEQDRLKAAAPTISWAVTVERNGEQIVTLASTCHGGRDISDEDARVIRLCAEQLLSFVGPDDPRRI